MNPVVALTIAGSDSGGGAGIQADLKTFAAHRVFGTSVITALTAQNTVGVKDISTVDPGFVGAQLDAVLADLPVAAVKTGMLATPQTVALVAGYAPRLPGLVVDPVLVASSGDRLFTRDAERAYLDLLFPHAAVVTPNLREASVLLGRDVTDVDDAVKAAEDLAATGPRCVVVKGGHLRGSSDAVDVVWAGGTVELLHAPWIDTANNHGTGCTFAAATAARLALGQPVAEALAGAKAYVHAALTASSDWRLGGGHGPLAWGPFDQLT
ncbi:bifunctional hydroxymethylpyrimidine kinase/phosphomethylpyrimidine kinase [Dactylosporangium aurantiacum]|uniref:Bifunctional hydroxymethylpyrimidine kinase/phosphomethylpyrimidine kinase n=1 Tax=Dactylosporangium aurantiacum TaxID=35754 RepID=A0A9Q9MKW1_9ACTN|nr:bifunctional hydroxymethylpyrimidine kinase/phosphomethylpyrimidine kinase [Dactylosporangium aurantiacum]MDG6102507.1 bifunctional hydroxymethylpyrimidine kinase/phosphomethylpyrimidine kinase [Dactylosporangium aurantiacum]UWZ53217.1 bifunctional hydroxymethylpyrimidine kinase/phosphomethylpyrimidine kinase [Dactylosporangium aurantiacum]